MPDVEFQDKTQGRIDLLKFRVSDMTDQRPESLRRDGRRLFEKHVRRFSLHFDGRSEDPWPRRSRGRCDEKGRQNQVI